MGDGDLEEEKGGRGGRGLNKEKSCVRYMYSFPKRNINCIYGKHILKEKSHFGGF